MRFLKSLFIRALPTIFDATNYLLPTNTLDQLPPDTWLESIYTGERGDLLLAQLEPDASIYMYRRPHYGLYNFWLVAQVPEVQGFYGIVGVEVDNGRETYIAVGGNATSRGHPIPGSFSAWKLTFEPGERYDAFVWGRPGRWRTPDVTKVSDLYKGSRFLNGLASVPRRKNIVLVADSAMGTVGRLDVKKKKFDPKAFQFDEMKPLKGAPLQIGINGIKVFGGFLYWTNSYQVCIWRIKMLARGYPEPNAKPQLVANLSSSYSFLDDFHFDRHANIWAATNQDNVIVRIDGRTLEVETVAGAKDDIIIAGPTAVSFGKNYNDLDTLYVSTNGGLGAPVDGKWEGAKVAAVMTGQREQYVKYREVARKKTKANQEEVEKLKNWDFNITSKGGKGGG